MANGQSRMIDLIDDMCNGKDVFFRWVRVARDIMTSDVKTLTLDDTVKACLKFMKDNEVRHVPVMDTPTEEEGKPYFVGIVSERDVFRQVSPYVGKVGEEDTDSKALRQMLGQIVTRNPKSVSPETPIPDMIAIMVDNHIDTVPVLTDGDIVGIVTAADIIKLFVRLDAIRQLCVNAGKTEQKRRLVDVLSGGSGKVAAVLSSVLRTVEDIMTEQVVCLASEDNLAKATEVIQKGKFRHVPIVDRQRRLVGIISDRDILRHLPYSSKQRTSQAEVFRSRLFEVDSKDPILELPLTRIMRRDVVHVLPSCSFYNAVKTLHEMKINCLPVVDDEKKLRGIVTVTDVMRALLAAYALSEKPKG